MRYFNIRWLHVAILITCLTHLTTGGEPKIVIVGAGAAGIAAASKLFEHGFENITILEAENRIGGRVHTAWFDESWVDLGGQWVHGETGNIAFQLAWPLGLLEIPEEEEMTFVYNSDGLQIPIDIGNSLMQIYFNANERINEAAIGRNGSVEDYYMSVVNTEVKKYPDINQTLVSQFTKLFENFQNSVDASDFWYESSIRGQLEYLECAGYHMINWKDRGYGTILDILMKKYPNPEEELPVLNNTLLGSEVVNINYNSTEGKVLVETNNRERYSADHVIVTPSLGVLKEQYETLFTPHLPESKMNTIKGLSIGTVAKIYLSYEAPWWPNNFTSFAFIWNENERQEYENDPNKKWLLDLFGVFAVAHRPRLLCGWMSGPGVRVMETLPEDQVLNQTLALFDKFLGKSYNITRHTGFLRTNWYNNKHFRGTYSYRSMESERVDVWANQLAAPLLLNDKPIVMFAGEATHDRYYSTVHGAIESGFREANRLIDMYKIMNMTN